MPGTHARTTAPTARGQRTPTARPEGGQRSQGRTSAPRDGTRHPPGGRPPATPLARNAASQERTPWGQCWVPTPTPPAPGKHGQRGLAAATEGRSGEGKRLTPDAPHNSARSPALGRPSAANPAHSRGHAIQRDSAGVQVGGGPQSPAPRDGQSGEGKRLTPEATHNGERSPPRTTLRRHPRGAQPPARQARQRDSAAPPDKHTRGQPQLPAPGAGSRRRAIA